MQATIKKYNRKMNALLTTEAAEELEEMYLYKAHGRWTKITESWPKVGRGKGGGWNTGA